MSSSIDLISLWINNFKRKVFINKKIETEWKITNFKFLFTIFFFSYEKQIYWSKLYQLSIYIYVSLSIDIISP